MHLNCVKISCSARSLAIQRPGCKHSETESGQSANHMKIGSHLHLYPYIIKGKSKERCCHQILTQPEHRSETFIAVGKVSWIFLDLWSCQKTNDNLSAPKVTRRGSSARDTHEPISYSARASPWVPGRHKSGATSRAPPFVIICTFCISAQLNAPFRSDMATTSMTQMTHHMHKT